MKGHFRYFKNSFDWGLKAKKFHMVPKALPIAPVISGISNTTDYINNKSRNGHFVAVSLTIFVI